MILVDASHIPKNPHKKKKKIQILVDDVEYLLHIMWGKNLFCEYVVNDFYLFI